jgi:hypothetical protein
MFTINRKVGAPGRSAQFTLSWTFPDGNSATLIFDENVWQLLQSAARSEGIDAEELVSVALAGLIAKIKAYRLRQ